jgi:hypothetical protein
MYVRTPGAWCPQWWRHSAGVCRIEAMWHAWKSLRLDPDTGVSASFSNHADPHMAVLLSKDGPFRGCTPAGGHVDGRAKSLVVEKPIARILDADPEPD